MTAQPAAATTLARVRRSSVRVPMADLGPESPLPAFTELRALPPTVVAGADEEMAARVAYGRLTSPLPYRLQSDYGRAVTDRDLPALVLESDRLRVTVVPELGGRVWSIVHRDADSERELLYVAPRVQWANFGLTDAWFAGGLEWNLGSTGHSAMSSRPWHAGVVSTDDGDVLRMWEWERTRDLIAQVDLWIPPGSDRLHASVRITNPDPEDAPLYWWTNIAAAETERTRVLADGDHAWRTDYSGTLTRVPVPHPDDPDVDVSYPMTATAAADYFYEGTAGTGRWIAAVEPDGRGLVQTSTAGLRGRKLFCWGVGNGGHVWQRWLGGQGSRYLEIQAGWCPTQLEHDVLPGRSAVAWTETFGPLDLDPDDVAGDYATARAKVADAAHGVAPAELERRHATWLAEVADRAPDEILATGSGWGEVELALRVQSGSAAVPFPPVDDESRWVRGWLDGADVALGEVPVPPVSPRWTQRYVASGRTDAWTRYAHAVAAHRAGRDEDAAAAYAASLDAAPTPWAHRGLAVLAAQDRPDEAVEHYRRARALAPDVRGLATELMQLLLDHGRVAEAVVVADGLEGDLRDHGRTRLLRSEALAAAGRLEEAAVGLEDLEVPDLAEGDLAIGRLWRVVHPEAALPAHLDFAMKGEER